MFDKTLIAATAAILLSGCSTLNSIAEYAADANDEALKTSEFAICKGASVGAILRRYNTRELAEAWLKLCNSEQPNANIIVEGADNG